MALTQKNKLLGLKRIHIQEVLKEKIPLVPKIFLQAQCWPKSKYLSVLSNVPCTVPFLLPCWGLNPEPCWTSISP